MASVRQIETKLNRITTLKHGKTWSAAEFQRAFGKLYPGLSTADSKTVGPGGYLTFVTAQADLNRVLAEHGMKIRSSNYYSSFHVVGNVKAIADLGNKVEEKIKRIKEAKDILVKGSRKYKANRKRALSKAERKRMTDRVGNPVLFDC